MHAPIETSARSGVSRDAAVQPRVDCAPGCAGRLRLSERARPTDAAQHVALLPSHLRFNRPARFSGALRRGSIRRTAIHAGRRIGQAKQLQAVEAAYGANAKAFFVAAFAPAQSVEQLIALVNRAMGGGQPGGTAAASSPHRPTATTNGAHAPRPVPIPAAAAATSSSSAAAAASSARASFSLAPTTSYPRLVAAAAAAAAAARLSSDLVDLRSMANWRILRAVFQSTRKLDPDQEKEITVHVNISADDQSVWDELNDRVQEYYEIKPSRPSEREIPVVLCTSNMVELVHPQTSVPLIRALRESSLQSPSMVVLVFDLDSDRRIVRNVIENISFAPHHTMVTEDPGEVRDRRRQTQQGAGAWGVLSSSCALCARV